MELKKTAQVINILIWGQFDTVENDFGLELDVIPEKW